MSRIWGKFWTAHRPRYVSLAEIVNVVDTVVNVVMKEHREQLNELDRKIVLLEAKNDAEHNRGAWPMGKSEQR